MHKLNVKFEMFRINMISIKHFTFPITQAVQIAQTHAHK